MEARSPKTRWRRRLLALAIGLGAPLLVGEVLVRVTVGAPLVERLPILRIRSDPYRGWEMVPGEAHYTYQHRVHVNALGLRGAEVGPKQPGEERVLALGDSLVYGQGVGDDETLPAYLQAELNAHSTDGTRWDVVNGGLRAYDTHQELGLLNELGDAIQPDVVVIFWYWNDIHERDIPGTAARLAAKKGPVTFDTNDNVEGWSWVRWHLRQLVRRSALIMYLHDLILARGGGGESQDYVDRAMKRLGKYLDDFVAITDKRGARLYFAPIPDSSTLTGGQAVAALTARAKEVACAHGVPVIDLLPGLVALTEKTGRRPVLPFDGHYQPAANHAMAAAVAAALEP